jgi:hypothetical protein
MKLLQTLAFSLLALIIIDIAVSLSITGFKYHDDTNKLKQYFDYGTSTKHKLKYLLGDSDENVKPISFSGWLDTLPDRKQASQEGCAIKMTVYGMSFSDRIASELGEIEDCYAIRSISGPSAPLSHSFYIYEKYKIEDDSDIVVLAILASALPKLVTMGHLSSSFEYPGSHLYPRYGLNADGELSSTGANISSRNEFREVLRDPNKEKTLVDLLSEHDEYFSEFVFAYEWMDYSNTLKMLRRAYAQKHTRDVISKYFFNGEFINSNQFIEIAHEIVRSFIQDAKERENTPVIILLNDRGYANSLDDFFIDLLESQNVIYFSSSDVINSDDLTNFLSDGHFTSENDRLLAAKLDAIVKPNIETKYETGAMK